MQKIFKPKYTLGTAFFPLLLAWLLSGCAAYVSSPVPMERTGRSEFQPYKGEDGESLFVFKAMYFTDEDLEKNKKYYDEWLGIYFDEYNYCKKGYEIIKTLKQPFAYGPNSRWPSCNVWKM